MRSLTSTAGMPCRLLVRLFIRLVSWRWRHAGRCTLVTRQEKASQEVVVSGPGSLSEGVLIFWGCPATERGNGQYRRRPPKRCAYYSSLRFLDTIMGRLWVVELVLASSGRAGWDRGSALRLPWVDVGKQYKKLRSPAAYTPSCSYFYSPRPRLACYSQTCPLRSRSRSLTPRRHPT